MPEGTLSAAQLVTNRYPPERRSGIFGRNGYAVGEGNEPERRQVERREHL
jgi:hypothetical protein